MSVSLDNPQRLLLALDEGLDHEVVLVLYGRAALVLGYDRAPVELGATKDVDAIIQLREVEALSNDEQFWDARDSVNARFNDEGLYITHLFGEEQVFLRPEWEQHILPVLHPPTRWLRLFRPHTIDLILTKMMRGNDEQDMEDIRFLIEHDGITAAQMEPAFATVRMPDVIELHEAFARALPAVRAMLPG